MKYIKMALLTIFMILLTACGSGSSSSDNSTLDQEAAIQTIMNYAETGTPVPTVQDYNDAGVTGVTESNLADVNDAVITHKDFLINSVDMNIVEKIQTIVDMPVIKLTGADPQTIEVGNDYTELGATATDIIDGDITGSIVIDASAVDTGTVGTYTVTYNVSDTSGNAATEVTRTVNVVDTIAPVIKITGADPQTIEVGNAYTELGATATDNVDGDITGSIVINTSAVDTGTIGSYRVTYDVNDSSGNTAFQITRTVNVTDGTPPVIALNGANTMTIVQGGTYTELGAMATDTIDGDITGSIVIDASAVDTSIVGTYTVTYNVSDTAGNAAIEVTRTVNVTDGTPPVIALIGANTVTIVQGGIYTELGATATDTIDGDITGSVVIDASAVDTSTVGSYTVTYNVSDLAGNPATEVTRTVNVTDGTPPVITLIGENPMTILQGGTYTELGATATDTIDGDITGSIVIDASAVDTGTVGTYTVTYNVSDTAGNAATEVTRTVNVIASLVFTDNFDTDTLSTYTLSGPTSADTWRAQLRDVLMEGPVTLSKTLDATVQQGHFSLQFKPTTTGSYNGQIRITLKQDTNNYYRIILGNGNVDSGPDNQNLYVGKTTNGSLDTKNINNTVYYKANTNNKIDITFGPRGATVTALGTTATINTGNIPLDISSFDILVHNTTAYIDNISLDAQSAKNIQIMTPHPGHIQTGDTIEVNATADTGKTVTFTLNGETKTATETSGIYSASFIVPKGDYSIDANISGETGFNNTDHIDHIGRGDIYVALGDSITNGDYDDDLSDDISTDGRVKNMGFEAKLSDTLSLNNSYPVVVLNEGIGGEQSKGGAARLTDVITSHPEANTYLIMYGTNDASDFAVNGHSRPSGLGLPSTDGNYTDSFKDHMQQIITTLNTDGKTPVIAKILPVLGDVTSSPVSSNIEGLARNVNIREYNQVIDELAIENAGVLTLGPDFYDDFNTTFVPNFTGGDTLFIEDGYANALHPDGVGYSSMADWWFGAL